MASGRKEDEAVSTTVVNNPQIDMIFRFKYDGVMRLVQGEIDGDQQQIIGKELRRSGKFSYKIKRFSLAKIEALELGK
jgi:hypothetical protein